MSKDSKQEELIQHFETLKTEHLLGILFADERMQLKPWDLEMVKRIRKEYDLTDPVMNVAVHYTLIREGMNLVKHTLHENALMLSEKGFKTARESMNYVKWLHQSGHKKPKYISLEHLKSDVERLHPNEFIIITIGEDEYTEEVAEQVNKGSELYGLPYPIVNLISQHIWNAKGYLDLDEMNSLYAIMGLGKIREVKDAMLILTSVEAIVVNRTMDQ
ncbi:hypothetical protein [Priestia megaterium]|uniref:hypothetical protein n=1 Tax=Priestia megaterium TaxID=1404 RepID=UPI000BFDDA16|nr:hypothetical protein [Priestia megaterium]PGO60694.1 hypothetical protein CN981_09085 [Priestia megaterium]